MNKFETKRSSWSMRGEKNQKPIMKIIAYINKRMLLFVMSAHSFNRIFYFLIIQNAFNRKQKIYSRKRVAARDGWYLNRVQVRYAISMTHQTIQPTWSRHSSGDNFWYFIANIFHVFSHFRLSWSSSHFQQFYVALLYRSVCVRDECAIQKLVSDHLTPLIV